jgi:hypothetical protein
VLFEQIPAAVGSDIAKWRSCLKGVAEAKVELEQLVDAYVARAWQAMSAAVGETITQATVDDHARALRTWAASLPLEALDAASDPRVKGVVSNLLDDSTTPERIAVAVSARVTKSVHRWDDGELARFADQFRRLVEIAEEAALQALMAGADVATDTKRRLASMVERRLACHIAILNQLLGPKQATARLQGLLKARRTPKSTHEHEELFNG